MGVLSHPAVLFPAANGLLCDSRQLPAGGGSVGHQAEGAAAAELPEVLPRFPAAAGAGAARAPVAAPAGRRLPGPGSGEESPREQGAAFLAHLL